MGIGGTERQALEILRRLNRQRFSPHLYLIYRRGELLAEVPPDVPLRAYWDDRQESRGVFPGQVLWSQARHLRQTIRDWRIQLVYDRASHAAIVAGLGTPPEIPRISAVVADPAQDFAQSHRTFAWLKRRLLRRAYSRAAAVAAVSAGVRRGLVTEFGLPESRIVICPNLFDFPRIAALAQESSPTPPAGCLTISCVGRLQREKGQRVLLEALDILVHQRGHHDLHLWLVGDGPDGDTLRSLARERHLADHVTFLGFQRNPLPFMKQSHVFCLPSLFEGLPNALIEAMGCGTPVIAANCPSGPEEILEGGRWGRLVTPNDPNDLANALQDRLKAWQMLDPPFAGQLQTSNPSAQNWRARALEALSEVQRKYSAERGLVRLEQLFEHVRGGLDVSRFPLLT